MSRMTRLIVIFAVAVMSLIGLLHLTLQQAYAGGSVTNCSNDTDFSNALSTGGLVTFNCGGPATIDFSFYKQIISDTTIDGGGVITLSGSNARPLFQVSNGQTLTLTNITLANGYASSVSGLSSGAIENFGKVVIINSRLTNNRTWDGGGALHNYGEVIVSNSAFLSNTAEIAGGAIYNDSSGVITLTNVTISNNVIMTVTVDSFGGGAYNAGVFTMNGGDVVNNRHISSTLFSFIGGGLYNIGHDMTPGVMNLNNVTIQGNHASGGGGVTNYDGTLTMHGTNVYSNSSTVTGGGLTNNGNSAVLYITNSQIKGNNSGVGGGIYQVSTTSGASTIISQTRITANTAGFGAGIRNFSGSFMSIYQSTIDNNTASFAGSGAGGGGFANRGLFGAENVTFSGNTATDANGDAEGGAILSQQDSSVSLVNVTIDENRADIGGSIRTGPTSAAALYLHNTILANSRDPDTNLLTDNCAIAALTQDYGGNIANDPNSDSSCLFAISLSNSDPLLRPLAFNGGPTPTHLPRLGSPAIDGGDHTHATPPSVDQRGKSRFADTVDSGAVEISPGDPLYFVYLPITLK